jgi:hypothetical protein
MKIFLLYFLFGLKFSKCCSLDEYFEELIETSEKIRNKPFGKDFFIQKSNFIITSDKLLSEFSATEVLQKFYSNCSDKTQFFLFFWVNYQVGLNDLSFDSTIHTSYFIDWFRAVRKLVRFITVNFWELSEQDRIIFGQLALDLYYLKLKGLFVTFFPHPARSLLKSIELVFYEIERAMASNFYKFEVPNDIYSSLLHIYSKLLAEPHQPTHKINFFYHIKYLLKTEENPYTLLSWLIGQNTQFIKHFLHFCQLKFVDVDQAKDMIPIDTKSSNLIEGLQNIIPIFEICPKTNLWTIKYTIEELKKVYSHMDNDSIIDLELLLRRFHAILSK